MSRRYISSGTSFEPLVGYSRAVVAGDAVYVSGTTATKDGGIVGEGDAAVQTTQALKNVAWALERAGARLEHVVRTRLYVTNVDDWKKIGQAHAEFFGDIRPACTLVEVKRLIDPRMLIEIEVDAVIDS